MPGSPSVVAHRGDSLRFRENTLPALHSAVDVGADWVEVDVRTTGDGVSILLHDATLLRLWGLPVPASELDAAAIAGLGYADLRIPTLAEAASALAGYAPGRASAGGGPGLLIDTVDPVDAVAAWRALQGVPLAGLRVAWCGAREAMAAVRDLDPQAVVHLATESGYADPSWLARLRPTYLNMEATLLSPAVVAAAHELGLLVSAWTVDEAWAMAGVAELGADSITTNRPALLRRTLAAVPGPPQTVAAPAVAGLDTAELDTAELARAVDVARELAGWAAGYLRESLPGQVETKAHAADLVTEVDRAVERRVRSVLAEVFPTHLVVGEEEGGTARVGTPTWYLDPVDGTTNFAHGLAWSSFSLALAVDRTPLVGVVADPWRGEVWSAASGCGAWRDGLACWAGVPQREAPSESSDPLAGSVLLTEWAAHEPFPGQLDVLTRLAERHCTVRVMGSGTLSVTQVAAGRAAGCLIGAFHPEDHLAACVIAREAGAVVTDASGAVSVWPEGAFLVAAPGVCDDLARVCWSRQSHEG